MRYYLFIDESGEANINNPDPRFNIFVLCGVIFREDHYYAFDSRFKELKRKHFNDEDIVFHSIKMRSKSHRFNVFHDDKVLSSFYRDIEVIFKECNYTVFSSVIDKEKYKDKYPDKNQAYEDSLLFLCERSIKYIQKCPQKGMLHICLEKRIKGKDAYLKKYYTNFIKYGSSYVSTAEFQNSHPKLHFKGKQDNVNGLQFADLCAYPIARKHLSPDKPQPTFDLFEKKIYCNRNGETKGFGIKCFP